MSLAVPVRFDTISEQKRDETKPTRPLTASECPLLVETVCDPTLSAIANRPCVALRRALFLGSGFEGEGVVSLLMKAMRVEEMSEGFAMRGATIISTASSTTSFRRFL